jgi:hypothetical protein
VTLVLPVATGYGFLTVIGRSDRRRMDQDVALGAQLVSEHNPVRSGTQHRQSREWPIRRSAAGQPIDARGHDEVIARKPAD